MTELEVLRETQFELLGKVKGLEEEGRKLRIRIIGLERVLHKAYCEAFGLSPNVMSKNKEEK